jgi:TDG/mug DNA glycosylase family protein
MLDLARAAGLDLAGAAGLDLAGAAGLDLAGAAGLDLAGAAGLHLAGAARLDRAGAPRLDRAGGARPPAWRVRGDLEALPVRRGALGGAWARNSYLHVARDHLPMALADLHRALAVGAPLAMSVLAGDDEGAVADDDIGPRRFTGWRPGPLADVVVGAGFEDLDLRPPAGATDLWVRARRARTLADTVGPGMRLLVVGLNPSVVAADAGAGFAGATNRFWPAALAAGAATRTRDPWHALRVDGMGMTDLVKRATPGAAGLRVAEYREGAARVERLAAWLRPRVVVFVGLAGYRAGVDAGAAPGRQDRPFGGVPAWVMPSTSGANARTRLVDHVHHLRGALALT